MQPITPPTNCPACDSKLQLINDQLFCKNTHCPAQVQKKIEHFSKTLKIKGLGPVAIENLMLESVVDIYLQPLDIYVASLGEKVGTKVYNEVKASVYSDFATVLEGMSIPLIGGTAAAKLSKLVNSFDELNEVVCKEAGIGEKATANLQDWLYYDYPEIKEFLPFKFERVVSNPSTNGMKVCITGKLRSFPTKKEAATALEAKGYEVTDSLNKTVHFLVDEENKGSSKRVKAEDYGITIIDDLNLFLSL